MVSEQERLERYLKVLNEQLDRKRGTEEGLHHNTPSSRRRSTV